ncbi:MAG: 4-hydroxy-tetrahydrodipicolinate synthase [Gammaproteobacteria bacterium]|nr:4-hydroxy-tetrahydrodipicolinate synthase [Gammaproteobacteria bacterium]
MITGSIVALTTPFTQQGELDKRAFETLIRFHLDNGTDAIVVAGTTGESPTLTQEEQEQLIDWALSMTAKQVPIIAGTGCNCTRKTIECTKRAEKLGAYAALLVAPYYNKPTQEGLYHHYKAIHDAVDIPLILYNVPGRTASDILPDTVARLSLLPRIIGSKEATGDLNRVPPLLKKCKNTFLLFSGDDATAKDFILMGGHGVISVTANCAPRLMKAMVESAKKGAGEAATAYNRQILDLHRALFLESNPIPVKWALSEMGLIHNILRLPLLPLSSQHHSAVKHALEMAGAFPISP